MARCLCRHTFNEVQPCPQCAMTSHLVQGYCFPPPDLAVARESCFLLPPARLRRGEAGTGGLRAPLFDPTAEPARPSSAATGRQRKMLKHVSHTRTPPRGASPDLTPTAVVDTTASPSVLRSNSFAEQVWQCTLPQQRHCANTSTQRCTSPTQLPVTWIGRLRDSHGVVW